MPNANDLVACSNCRDEVPFEELGFCPECGMDACPRCLVVVNDEDSTCADCLEGRKRTREEQVALDRLDRMNEREDARRRSVQA